ncbi:hypothetical protein ATPR_0488 [Acetobacter tropicalis NBRC 101654]|uniref:Uncharacterized protein n=1 Tax=Acetobacter tropicalis NBRC 101654 TaxID=749388 RepID=F7VAT9_9PROT|nr:hypothetical protein ATPR_0488 [Acetobacter tropicalis NBRC 101654]
MVAKPPGTHPDRCFKQPLKKMLCAFLPWTAGQNSDTITSGYFI